MSAKYSDTDYLFLTSLLRARQAGMLSGELLEQMLDSGSLKEALRTLSEAGWPDFSGMDSKAVDETLSKRRADIFTDIARMIPQKEVLDLFRIRYDYHNAKCIIKGEGAGVSAAHLMSGSGRISRERLEKAYFEDDYRFVPQKLGSAMQEANSLLAKLGNPQLADFVLDKAFYAEMTDTAKVIDNAYITNYVKTMIDGANLRTAVRCARMQKDSEFLENALIPGGTVTPERIVQASSSGDGVTGVFMTTAFREAAVLGAEATKGGHLTAFELECDNTVNRYISDAKMRGFGPEAAVGYLAAEENNITAVRMVVEGLMAGISPDTLRERLRDSYV